MTTLLLACAMMLFSGCEKERMEYVTGDVKVEVEKGDNWLHDYPLILGINKKNPPQVAVWVEDMDGRYLSTLYVSYKAGTQGWQGAKGNRRKEALPHWCHQRGVVYADGLYLPTKEQPMADGLTGATPRADFEVSMHPKQMPAQFVVKAEFNHSIDWNDAYPKHAKVGDANYSGGTEGSGQPAVVYAAIVDTTSGKKSFVAHLIGHSSPDGSDGKVYADTSRLTSALHIVKQIKITIQ